MSTFDMIFVGFVASAMLLLMGALAWAMFYTRDRAKPATSNVEMLTPARRPDPKLAA